MEKVKKPKEKKVGDGGPQGLDDIFAMHASQNIESATVMCGPHADVLPVAGMSIEQIRNKFADKYDIDPDSIAMVDGQEVDKKNEDFIIKAGQVLMFTKKAGEKGATAVKKAVKKTVKKKKLA